MDITITDIIGYAASAVLLFSFTRKDIKTLRWINSLGCLLFVIYGSLIDKGAPVVITNLAIIAINAYYLFVKKQ